MKDLKQLVLLYIATAILVTLGAVMLYLLFYFSLSPASRPHGFYFVGEGQIKP
jgi:hypothetical protein